MTRTSWLSMGLAAVALLAFPPGAAAQAYCYVCVPDIHGNVWCEPDPSASEGGSFCQDGGGGGYCETNQDCGGDGDGGGEEYPVFPQAGNTLTGQAGGFHLATLEGQVPQLQAGHVVVTNCSGRVIARRMSLAAAVTYLSQSREIRLVQVDTRSALGAV